MSAYKRGEDYVPLNNLDEFDHRLGGMRPEGVWDTVPFEESIDERYASLTFQEGQQLAYESFFAGANEQATTIKTVDYEHFSRKKDASIEDMVYASLRIVVNETRQSMRDLSDDMQWTDRVQNSCLALVDAAKKYDMAYREKSSLASYVRPFLPHRLRKYENAINSDINHGELITIDFDDRKTYHRFKRRRKALETRYRRPIEVDEVVDYSSFRPETVDVYKRYEIEHVPFHELGENDLVARCDEEPEVQTTTRDVGGVDLALELVSEEEGRVLIERLGLHGQEPKSLTEIAAEKGYTRQNASLIEKRALRKLRGISNIRDVVETPVWSTAEVFTKCAGYGRFVAKLTDATEVRIVSPKVAERNTARIMTYLDESEQAVIAARYGIDGTGPKTLNGVADSIGISQRKVNYVETRAINKLRKLPNALEAVGVVVR